MGDPFEIRCFVSIAARHICIHEVVVFQPVNRRCQLALALVGEPVVLVDLIEQSQYGKGGDTLRHLKTRLDGVYIAPSHPSDRQAGGNHAEHCDHSNGSDPPVTGGAIFFLQRNDCFERFQVGV